jgi:hypothetical protein
VHLRKISALVIIGDDKMEFVVVNNSDGSSDGMMTM